MREIILDTETTGLDPVSGHRIIEIGCVEMLGKCRTGNTFHRYINPLREVPKEAESVHGISTEFLLDKPTFDEIAEELIDFLKDDTLVIHNAGFDIKFLNHELQRLGYYIIPMERVTCSLNMARKKFPGSPASLDALCRRYDIDLTARTKHGALLDAELLSEVYIELCGGRQVQIDFTSRRESALDSAEIVVAVPARQFSVSAEEAAAHAALIEKLKEPLWNLVETA